MKMYTKIFFTILLVFVFTPTVFAFEDIQGVTGEEEILALKKEGIIQGVTKQNFAPNADLTYAQGIALIVRTFDLNLAHFTFIKEPQASDYYTNVKDNQWYSTPFTYAHLNGIKINKDVMPNQKLTKEQFADLVYQAMIIKHDISFIEIWKNIKDEGNITSQYMDSIQKMVIADITPLDNGNFYPQKVLSRGESVVILYRTMEYVRGL